ncbi:Reverse transcriptase [Phytophthora palmivora]|uniref:Reverse transcriptase n=1 Tax=Phytophthora palmivora TaxID=4796 RepID=A0A2P4Y9Q0_9STRA|nr:Reverse transcriptase [Phytophthora palmivora]
MSRHVKHDRGGLLEVDESRLRLRSSADDKGNTKGVWDTLFQLLGTELTMSSAVHPRTDGQTERVNSVLEDTLRSIYAEAPRSWSDQLSMVEFAHSNAIHASTGFNPFVLLKLLRPPQVPLTLR